MKRKAFTLIELLATIALVAILATSAVVAVNYFINKQKEKIANIAEEHISQAALTYFGNKKSLFIESCVDKDGDYTSISQSVIKRINDKIREDMNRDSITTDKDKYEYAKRYVSDISTNSENKENFNNTFLDIDNFSCFRLVTVGELVDAGLLEDKDNMCNKASVVMVYQKGDAKNKAGVATAVQEPKICNGSSRKENPPTVTVTPDKDSTPTVGKNINIAIYDENRALKNTINLEYKWSSDKNTVPTSGWSNISISSNKKKGSADIYKENLDGNNYLWVRSSDTVDAANNVIDPFVSGPYNFLKLMTIGYNDNGGSGCTGTTKVVVYSFKYGQNKKGQTAKLCEPSRDGYSRAGWTLDGVGINDDTIVNRKDDHTLVYRWSANSYIVTYDTKGGNACNPTTKDVIFDDNYGTLCSTSRNGYTFLKWVKHGTSTEIKADTKVTTVGNHTIDATWKANDYTITYKDNIGSGCNNTTKSVTFDQNYGTLCNPSSTSHDFGGWYLNTTKITNTTKVNTASHHELVAKWTLKTYSLSFNGNGNTGGSTAAVTCSHNTDCTIPANGFSKTNYGFQGWATSSGGAVVYHSGDKIKITSATTLYAKWLGNQFTIKYYGNGSTSGSMADTVCRYGETCTLSNNAFGKTNYTFAGWATSATGNVAYNNGANMNNAGGKNLYAKWNGNAYTISFNGNGNTGGSTAAKSCNYGTACTLTANGFSKTDHSFTGWATTSGGNVAYNNQASVTDLGTTTLYAKWQQNAIRRTYTGSYSGGANNTTVSWSVSGYVAAKGVTASTLTNGVLGTCTYSGGVLRCPITSITGTTANNDTNCALANGTSTTYAFYYGGKCYVKAGGSPAFSGDSFRCGSRRSPRIPGSSHHCPSKADNGHVHCTSGNNCVTAEKHNCSGCGKPYQCWCWSKGTYVKHTLYSTSYTLVYYTSS